MRSRMGAVAHPPSAGIPMFDTLLSNTAAGFGIPAEKAKQLLGLLIALIFNE